MVEVVSRCDGGYAVDDASVTSIVVVYVGEDAYFVVVGDVVAATAFDDA